MKTSKAQSIVFGLLLLATAQLHAETATTSASAQSPVAVDYVSGFTNSNHPEICYWFFSKDQIQNENYLAMVDQLVDKGLYTMAFITARNGVDFYNTETMHPVFARLVEHAHQRGLKIGLQLWPRQGPTLPLEDCERLIVEGEVTLDANGAASYTAQARGARAPAQAVKSELLRAFAFQRKGDGFYDPTTLQDITAQCLVCRTNESTVQVEIKAGPAIKGATVYLMTQHYYNYASNHSPAAWKSFVNALESYRDIPFDGVALDEFKNLSINTESELRKAHRAFRERYYSPAMAREYAAETGTPLERALFDMRYAPEGKPEVRMRAINTYMAVMRRGVMPVETAVYKAAKEIFGPDTFVGCHDTVHNNLTGDEVWISGINWWNIPRDYGQTDEINPFSTMLGVGFANRENAMYNMYYNKSLNNVVEKSLNCLRYGIRTHYHAVHDIQGWGVSMEKPETLAAINPVERCARLLNRFNPSFPEIKLLVVFGTEAIYNWYPDASQRGVYDINDKLGIEEKGVALWNAGYLNIIVPSDLIESGKLRLNGKGKPELNGHVFDAVVYLDPEYARESELKFLEAYTKAGGKFMVEGTASHDFQANDITARFAAIRKQAVATRFDVDAISRLGISRNLLPDGCRNEDGSYVYTDLPSLKGSAPASFQMQLGGVTYSGRYHGLAAIAADSHGVLEKFTAAGFEELRRDGKLIFKLDQPADIFITGNDRGYVAIIDTDSKPIKPKLETN